MGQSWRNQTLPYAEPGRGILIPIDPSRWEFRPIRDSHELLISELMETKPVARLIMTLGSFPCRTSAVYRYIFSRKRGYISTQSRRLVADCIYLMESVRFRDTYPVVNPRDGKIYDLLPFIPTPDLQRYRRILDYSAMQVKRHLMDPTSHLTSNNRHLLQFPVGIYSVDEKIESVPCQSCVLS